MTVIPLEHWIAFLAAAAVLVAIPGPTVLLVVSYALGHGRRIAPAAVAGVALGDLAAVSASLLGLGVVLAASATVFTALKWAGAAYLVWLGVKLWRAPILAPDMDVPAAGAGPAPRPGRILAHAFAVTALNPKGIVFFVAFLPQFVDPDRPAGPQMALLAVTFVAVATVNAALYAALAASARRAVRRPPVQRAVNRVGGACLVAAGVATAAWRRVAA